MTGTPGGIYVSHTAMLAATAWLSFWSAITREECSKRLAGGASPVADFIYHFRHPYPCQVFQHTCFFCCVGTLFARGVKDAERTTLPASLPKRTLFSIFSHRTHKGHTVPVRFLFLPRKEVYENLHTAMLGAAAWLSFWSAITREERSKRLASGASPRRRFPRRVWLLLPSVADYPALSNVRRKTVCSQCGKERGVENRTSVYDFQHEF